ncbi:hypothetical protein B7988_13155 [Fibrobacter sp. UWB1]|nr:hypothetical protein B7988_13155 [Fibrobacter sp. UWB1]
MFVNIPLFDCIYKHLLAKSCIFSAFAIIVFISASSAYMLKKQNATAQVYKICVGCQEFFLQFF